MLAASVALAAAFVALVDAFPALVEAFAKGDFSARLDEARTDTEVGRLTSALNQMLARIEEAFAVKVVSEDKLRRFVADASHELRRKMQQRKSANHAPEVHTIPAA